VATAVFGALAPVESVLLVTADVPIGFVVPQVKFMGQLLFPLAIVQDGVAGYIYPDMP
jgi:hypothetical protein